MAKRTPKGWMNKANRRKFNRLLVGFLATRSRRSWTEMGTMYWTIDTKYGELRLCVHPYDWTDRENGDYTPSVFGRFNSGDNGLPYDANKYSGKWNHHYSAWTDPVSSFNGFLASMASIGIDS